MVKPVRRLAFVLLSAPAQPRGDDIAAAIRRFDRSLSIRTGEETADGLELGINATGALQIVGVPFPVPNGEAEAAAALSFPNRMRHRKLGAHGAQLVVSYRADDVTSLAENLDQFTSMLAGVVQATDAVGVYWGDAGATHDAQVFLEMAKDPARFVRVMLWNGVSFGRESAERGSLLSGGMSQLELPDLLLGARLSQLGAAVPTFFDLLSFVAQRGEPIPEGDTVGNSASERLRVRYVPSPLDGSTRVWRVDLP